MTRALLAIALFIGVAHGERRVLDPEPLIYRCPDDQWNRLGTRVMYGLQPIDDAAMTTMSIGVSIDRAIYGEWRVLGEYEYLWIGPYDLEAHSDLGVASLADSGHRVHLGMRRELLEKRWAYGRARLFVDGEAGGGAMLVDRMRGSSIGIAHGFAGARAGLSLVSGKRRLDYEVVVRGLATPGGPGVLFGIGLVWGE